MAPIPIKLHTVLAISLLASVLIVKPYSRNRFPIAFSQELSDLALNYSDESNSDAIIVSDIKSSEPQTGSQHKSNYKSNVTKSNVAHEDEELREILCPKSPTLRYDLRAGKCAELDTSAHCGKNMIFKEEIASSCYGYCDCDFENHEVPLVFHLASNTCYPVYQQGYCKFGEWLVLSKEANGPVCKQNQCFMPVQKTKTQPRSGERERGSGRRSKLIFPGIWESSSNSGFGHDPVIKIRDNHGNPNFNLLPNQVPLDGSGPCVTLGATSKFCSPGEKVIFEQSDIFPKCKVPGKNFRRLSIIPNPCAPGSYYSIVGYCQPVWDF